MGSVIPWDMETTQRLTGLPAKPSSPIKVRYCLYARKSTEQEDRQVLSIDSQIVEMQKMAATENLEIVITKKESHSAKIAGERPVFNEIIEDIKKNRFDGILTWAPDRISRNAGDLGKIVDLIDQGLLKEIRTFGGQKFTNNPNEKFLLMILGSQAKLENDNKVINVRRGLRARAAMGLKPSLALTGYLNSKNKDEKCQVTIDPIRAPIIKKMFEKVAHENQSGRQIYRWLKDSGFTTRTGKALALGNIYRLLRMPFYYGVFEYPKGSGEWYQGKHEPIISKDLFDIVQDKILGEKKKAYGREFAFTRMLECGYCKSGVTAEEKVKELKDGSVKAYVFYRCTKLRNLDCNNDQVSEQILIDETLKIIDGISLDKSELRQKLEKEVARYALFQTGVLKKELPQIRNHHDINIKTFAKYILQHGTLTEKREVLSCIKNRIILKDKALALAE